MLVFRTCHDCGANLVTESGEIYNLPPISTPSLVITPTDLPSAEPIEAGNRPLDPMHGLRLSPDGRWLARHDVGGLRLRDLTSTRTLRIDRGPQSDDGAWSNDGRWLVVSDRQEPTLWDLESGMAHPIKVPEQYRGWRIVSVFGPDQVMLRETYARSESEAVPDPDRSHEMYVTIDPATGAVLHEYPVDVGDRLELVSGQYLIWITQDIKREPNEVVVGDLFEGGVVARFSLPVESPPGYQFWGIWRFADGGVVLIRDFAFDFPPVRADPVQFFTLDLASGERTLVCTLPPMVEYLLRR
ncbi:MAG TPA: hypothetical protein VF163_07920 [Micromonosporaceae bacterium]